MVSKYQIQVKENGQVKREVTLRKDSDHDLPSEDELVDGFSDALNSKEGYCEKCNEQFDGKKGLKAHKSQSDAHQEG